MTNMQDVEFITTDIAKQRDKRINIMGKITKKGDVRDVKGYKICDCVLTDTKGTVGLTLWNEHTNEFNTGDIVEITNGIMKEFRDQKSLNIGKFGRIKLVERTGSS